MKLNKKTNNKVISNDPQIRDRTNNNVRKVVIEHDIWDLEEGMQNEPIVVDGNLWGTDFDLIVGDDILVDEPVTLTPAEGQCPKTKHRVLYTSTFMLTQRTDSELLYEYKIRGQKHRLD